MADLHKYPRTPHLPSSPGATADDRILPSIEHFEGQEVVVTEKIDGENTTMYSGGYMHARSRDSASHPSQSRCRALAARVGLDIPEGWRVSGENVYALHSIPYDRLTAFFYVFGIYDDQDCCLSWNDTVQWAELLGLETAPVLYRGTFDLTAIEAAFNGVSAFGDTAEGYVVRLACGFPCADFARNLAKWVRPHHVQDTDEHWRSKPVVPNRLVSG